MLNLFLQRTKCTPAFTEGYLLDKNTGEKICDTLEDALRSNRYIGPITHMAEKHRKVKIIPWWKIPGYTCIEAGYYKLITHFSPSFNMEMIMLEDVPFFDFIYLHYAYTTKNTQGCIGIGKRQDEGILINNHSREKLFDMFKKEYKKGYIEIRNPKNLAL